MPTFIALHSSRVVQVLAIGAILCAAVGCGGRQTLEGTVTLDDRPLEQGYINFRPASTAKGPPVGAPIQQGKYAIAPESELEGNFRVEITALGKTGGTVRDASGANIDIEGQVLPARYNTDSQLQAEIKPHQRNEAAFPLKSE
jgi:hypothetical protein